MLLLLKRHLECSISFSSVWFRSTFLSTLPPVPLICFLMVPLQTVHKCFCVCPMEVWNHTPLHYPRLANWASCIVQCTLVCHVKIWIHVRRTNFSDQGEQKVLGWFRVGDRFPLAFGIDHRMHVSVGWTRNEHFRQLNTWCKLSISQKMAMDSSETGGTLSWHFFMWYVFCHLSNSQWSRHSFPPCYPSSVKLPVKSEVFHLSQGPGSVIEWI